MRVAPQALDIAEHAHRLQRFDLLARGAHQKVFGRSVFGSLKVATVGNGLVGGCQDDEDDGAQQGEQAEYRMEQENDGEVDRKPGDVEQGRERGARDELLHSAQIAGGRWAGGALRGCGVERDIGQVVVECLAEPNQKARADPFEHAVE